MLPADTVLVRDDGSIELPLHIRDALMLRPGTRLALHLNGERLTLIPQPWPSFHTLVGSVPIDSELDAVALVDQLRHDPDDRAALDAGPPPSNVTVWKKP